MGICLIVET